MELSKFCPICGKDVDKLYGDSQKVCGDCYLEKRNLINLPENICLEKCRVCNKIKYENIWRENLEPIISSFGTEGANIRYEIKEGNLPEVLEIEAQKSTLIQKKRVTLEYKDSKCSYCVENEEASAKTVVQVRGKKKDTINELIRERASNLQEENFRDHIIEEKKRSGGINFYLSTEHMAQQILDTLKKQYNINIERSYKQISNKDGKKIFQNTIVVKLNDSIMD